MTSANQTRPCGTKRCVEEDPGSQLTAGQSLVFHAWADTNRRPKREKQLVLRGAPKTVLEKLAHLRRCVDTGISVARGFFEDDSLWPCGTLTPIGAINEAQGQMSHMLQEAGVSERCALCISRRAFADFDFEDDFEE